MEESGVPGSKGVISKRQLVPPTRPMATSFKLISYYFGAAHSSLLHHVFLYPLFVYHTVIPNYGIHPWYIAERSPNWRNTFMGCFEAVPAAASEQLIRVKVHGKSR